MDEIEKLNAYCFGLIHAMRGMNAEEMTLNQNNVTYKGEVLGDYKITVEKIVPKNTNHDRKQKIPD